MTTATLAQIKALLLAQEVAQALWEQENTNLMAEGLAWNARNALRELLVELYKERKA